MKKQLIFSLTLILCGFTFFACDKDEENEKESELVTGTVTFNASAYDKWVYYSFEDTAIVTIDDYKTSTAWDIGFHRYDVRVNCGTSGPGLGGTNNAGKVDFASVTEAPETGYSLNASIEAYESSPITGGTLVTMPGDTLLAKWLTFSYVTGSPTYTINDNIYVIKTASGKYAKLWLKDYFNDEAKSGYVTMKFAYQPDGGRKLQ